MNALKVVLLVAALLSLPNLPLEAAAPTRPGAGNNAKPNIVLIVADDLGYNDLGCYGASLVKTPRIDALARQGVRFTDAHSMCAICIPSRYSILSGTYYFHAKFKGRYPLMFHEGQVTLPSLLKSAGYRTAALGKWHNGFGREPEPDYNQELKPGPLEIGFDSFFGTPRTHSEPPLVFVQDHGVVGLDPADPISLDHSKQFGAHGKQIGGAKAAAARADDQIDFIMADKAARYIAEQKFGRPFFLYLAFAAVHNPIDPAPEFRKRSQAGLYGDYAEQLDHCTGLVLDALAKSGLAQDTLVIFTSDNGGRYENTAMKAGHRTNGELLGQKTDAWEGGHRVPCIARWPEHIPAGTVRTEFFVQVDLLATLAEAAGIALPAGASPDGRSELAAFLQPTVALAKRTEALLHGSKGIVLRQGDWIYFPKPGSLGYTAPEPERPFGLPYAKMGFTNSDINEHGQIKPGASPEQLYNLATDLRQTKNLAAEQPNRVRAMRARLLELAGPAAGGRAEGRTHRLISATIMPLVIAGAALNDLAASPPPAPALRPPVNIIFDTDMGDDCDDVGALFILHGAVERGEARLLATMGCISSEAIAPALDAINTWFGRPEIPVGTLKQLGFLAGPHYTAEIARRFPRQHASGKDYPDAVTLYRQVLEKQPDSSVVVLAVGPLRNLANLLKSPPDAASPLDGRALVAQKVKRLEVMGGTYPPLANTREAEWNFKQDPAAAALVCANWPTPVLFNGEGGSTCSGRRVTYEMPEHNPLTMAYRHYAGVGFAGDRLSWDSISSLVAVRGAAPWYKVVSGGVNVTDATTGINTWQAGGGRGHAYLVLQSRKPEIEQTLEDMMVAGKGRPTKLMFNTAYYADAGMCQITSRGAAEAATSAIQAFDHNDQTAWLDKAAASWIQCQYADGRKYRVTCYTVVCRDNHRLPRTIELSGSNDDGASWTVLDVQQSLGFTPESPRRQFAIVEPAKWNLYRLGVTAANETEGIQISTFELNESIHCRPKALVEAVFLDRTTLTLPANSRTTVNATLMPLETWDREVTWVSSDVSVAEVRRIGEQTAVVVGKQPGTCTVTATIDNAKQACTVTVTPSTLPNGWSYHELNTPPIPGAVSVAEEIFTVTGCGHAMSSWWERVRDQGVFVSQPVTGDVAISARLTRLAPNVGGPNAYPWDSRPPTTAGLMIRESLDQACGRYLLVQVEASGHLVCRWRDRTGDQDDNQTKNLGKVKLPIHLKLVQTGGKTLVFASADGENWDEPRMSHTATFDATSRVGLFVCSGNTFASATAVFDSVTTKTPVTNP